MIPVIFWIEMRIFYVCFFCFGKKEETKKKKKSDYCRSVHTDAKKIKVCQMVSIIKIQPLNDKFRSWKMTPKNMLTYSFFCYCKSTEGTYHRQFGKYARSSMFRSWAKILLFSSSKTFQCSYLKIYIYLTLI